MLLCWKGFVPALIPGSVLHLLCWPESCRDACTQASFIQRSSDIQKAPGFQPEADSRKALIAVAGFCRESQSIAKCDTTLLSTDQHRENSELSPATSPAGTRDATFNPPNATVLSVSPHSYEHTFMGLPSPWETSAEVCLCAHVGTCTPQALRHSTVLHWYS